MPANIDTPAGYYDRFSTHLDWKRILFKPGFPLQSAEMNELQSMHTYQFSLLAQNLFKDGTFLSGGAITVADGEDDTILVTIGAGELYAFGFVHQVPEGVVEIEGVGVETISLIINEKIIKITGEDADLTLKDPALGAENYGEEGADRLVFEYFH